MIKHVVLFKMKAFGSETEKADVRDQIKDSLLALKDKINELKFIEVGTNYQIEAASYDICLITHFDTIEDLKIYVVHPDHVKVSSLVRENTVERAAVDFEF